MLKKINQILLIIFLCEIISLFGVCFSSSIFESLDAGPVFYFLTIALVTGAIVVTGILQQFVANLYTNEQRKEQQAQILYWRKIKEQRSLLLHTLFIKLQRDRKILDERVKQESMERELDLLKKQVDFQKKITEKFLIAKANPEIITVLENFFPKIPLFIFSTADYYNLFEYLLSKDCEIALKILWSSTTELLKTANSNARIYDSEYVNESIAFVGKDFSKLEKLFARLSGYDNKEDVRFVLLRLLQAGAISYYSQVFAATYKVDFGDVETLALEECLFIYYRN